MLRCSFAMTVLLGLAGGLFPSVAEAKDYYVSNKAEAGKGTKEDPFGMPDLSSAGQKDPKRDVGNACAGLQPGDTLWFKGGEYLLQSQNEGGHRAVIRAARSGEKGKPISFRAMPGEKVVLVRMGAEWQTPIVGTSGTDYIRFEGLTLEMREPGGHKGKPTWVQGTGIEFAYCEVIVNFKEGSDGSNPAAFRPDRTDGLWIHHCIIRGKNNDYGIGFEAYRTTNAVIEHNWFVGNRIGLFDKDSGINNHYRHNYVTGIKTYAFLGNNQAKFMQARVYDNVLHGPVHLGIIGEGTEVHDNLLLNRGITAQGNVWNTKIWNNIVLAPDAKTITGYSSGGRDKRNTNGERELPEYKELEYLDYNLYTAPTTYAFGKSTDKPETCTMDQMRQKGFEKHSHVVDAAETFVDQKSYKLLPKWTKAGRDGSSPGPENIALILDTSRYGPEARPKK